jgi:hypothetical protein
LFQQGNLTDYNQRPSRSRLIGGSKRVGSERVKFASGRGFRVVPERLRTVYEARVISNDQRVIPTRVCWVNPDIESGHLLLCDLVEWSGVSGVTARVRVAVAAGCVTGTRDCTLLHHYNHT